MQTPLMRRTRDWFWQVWIGTVGNWFRVGSLAVDESVDRQFQQLAAENVHLKAELRDLAEVQKQIGSAGFEEWESIPVRIAPMPLDPYKIQFAVNKGAQEGVHLGAPVVIDGPILIGFVTELQEYSATVRLLFHPETGFSGEIEADEISGRGLVTGDSFTGIKMVKIPRDMQLVAGMPVVTSEELDKIPGSIFVGEIERVLNDQHDPYQQVIISAPYRADELRAAVILISP